MALLDLQMQIVGGYARYPLSPKMTPRRFDRQHHLLVRIAPDNTEKAREPRLEKAPVESKLASLEDDGRGRFGRGRLFRLGVELETASRCRDLPLHWVDRLGFS